MTGILRNPRWQITCGGNPFPYFEAKVRQERTRTGDTFNAKAALSLVDLQWWYSVAAPVAVTITMNGTQLFAGNVDHADADFFERTFEICGRDAAAVLNDTQTSEKFLNQKPEQIVQTIAQRHGIEAEIDSTDSTDAGKQYSSDFDAISNRGSEWTFINKLADHYGMIAYMTGGKLYFKHPDEQLPIKQIWYRAPTPENCESGNFTKLKAVRNFILGKPIKVNVHSHNHRRKEHILATARSEGGSGDPLVYNHTIAGINQDQAQTIAQQKLNEVAAHEMKITELEIPGDETINARTEIQLSGTNTPLDQKYDMTSVDHAISIKEGYRTGLVVKNKKQGGGKGSGAQST